MNKFDGVLGVVGVGVGLLSLGYAYGMHCKMAQIGKNLDRSIDELASNTPVDIPDGLVERAVEKAVEREVKCAVSKATERAIAEVQTDIHKKVGDAVESEYSKIKETVLRELTEEAAKIDVKRVRADIEQAAKKKALEKFDDNLDEITEEYKGYLHSVSKIGKTFADAVTQPRERDLTLRLG